MLPAGQGADSKVSRLGLARPLMLLTGGLSPAPRVFFNTTDARSGYRIWLSNEGKWGDEKAGGDLDKTMQVGQAVLHSARFPVVSPSGALKLTGVYRALPVSGSPVPIDSAREVVDAGYADNSGASTLADSKAADRDAHWLSIDGNPPQSCGGVAVIPLDPPWTGAGALFAVRESQAALAVTRFVADKSFLKSLVLDLDGAFAGTMPDPKKRCAFVQGMRQAPLGWYMSHATVGDQKLAIFKAVEDSCAVLAPLCGPPGGAPPSANRRSNTQ